jgi:DNA repair exonuclease SbcCD nuclease subunit
MEIAMLKILLTSDLHLGMGDELSPIPESARQSTFKKICGLAREHDVMLVAGDMFHRTEVTEECLSMVRAEFEELRTRGVEIVMVPGEHECTAASAPADFLSDLGAAHLFSGDGRDACFTMAHNGQTLWVYGAPAARKDLVDAVRRNDEPGFHAGLFHADFRLKDDDTPADVPILKKRDIRAMGLDFYALGHLHSFKLFKYKNRIIGACAGSPEAVRSEETGDRFVLSIMVQNDEIYQIKRLAVNSMRLDALTFDCGETRPDEILGQLAQRMSPRTIMTCTLTGRRDYDLDQRVLDKLARAYQRLIIRDETLPGLRVLINAYCTEKSLRGDFFRLVRERVSGTGIPGSVDADALATALTSVSRTSRYVPEEWL